jgi:hypothetical protein
LLAGADRVVKTALRDPHIRQGERASHGVREVPGVLEFWHNRTPSQPALLAHPNRVRVQPHHHRGMKIHGISTALLHWVSVRLQWTRL